MRRCLTSGRRPPPRRGSTLSAAASPLPLPLSCEERRGAGRRESFDEEPQAVVARWDSVVTCTSFRCTLSLIWTTTSSKSTHHGVGSSTLVTTTCELEGKQCCTDQHVLETSCAVNGGPRANDFPISVPMDHEEKALLRAHRDPSLWKQRACELEGKPWCTDRHESETVCGEQLTSCCSHWWNSCDDEHLDSFRGGVCTETPIPTPVLTSPPTPASAPAPTQAPTSAPIQSNFIAEHLTPRGRATSPWKSARRPDGATYCGWR